MVFTKSLSNGQLLDSAEMNTLVGDISGTWAVNTNDRFCISGETYSVTGAFPLTHYYYLNPGADVYTQLKRLKLSYGCAAGGSEGYWGGNIGIQVYYNVGGGEVKIYEHFEVFNHWGHQETLMRTWNPHPLNFEQGHRCIYKNRPVCLDLLYGRVWGHILHDLNLQQISPFLHSERFHIIHFLSAPYRTSRAYCLIIPRW